MFSPDLNRLIEASLTDGVLTDQERAVIKKRALLEGIDPDEVDVILESKLQELQQKADEAIAKVKKCPACGAIMGSLQTRCPQCGNEITHAQANSSIQKLTEKIEAVTNNNRGMLDADERIASAIRTFPVPMTREDLVEFIIAMQSRWKNTSTDAGQDKIKQAYKAKYDECLTKAKILFADDPAFQSLFAQAQKDNTAFSKFRNSGCFMPTIIGGILAIGWLILFILANIFGK